MALDALHRRLRQPALRAQVAVLAGQIDAQLALLHLRSLAGLERGVGRILRLVAVLGFVCVFGGLLLARLLARQYPIHAAEIGVTENIGREVSGPILQVSDRFGSVRVAAFGGPAKNFGGESDGQRAAIKGVPFGNQGHAILACRKVHAPALELVAKRLGQLIIRARRVDKVETVQLMQVGCDVVPPSFCHEFRLQHGISRRGVCGINLHAVEGFADRLPFFSVLDVTSEFIKTLVKHVSKPGVEQFKVERARRFVSEFLRHLLPQFPHELRQPLCRMVIKGVPIQPQNQNHPGGFVGGAGRKFALL